MQLTVVGCLPPPGFVRKPGYVSLLGYIPKFNPEGVRRLAKLMGESHLLILPTVAECAAVALTEANAYGLPFLGSDVGGNSSLVRQHYNGILLPLDLDASAWADAAMSILRDRGTYERFVWQAYNFFHQQLSWENAVSEFEVAVQELLPERRHRPSRRAMLIPADRNREGNALRVVALRRNGSHDRPHGMTSPVAPSSHSR